MFRSTKLDVPVFDRCVVRQSILLNQVQQNRMVRSLKLKGPEFLGHRMRLAKQRRSMLMIRGHPWYVILRTLVILLIEKFGAKL
jgi:hypothetical protein